MQYQNISVWDRRCEYCLSKSLYYITTRFISKLSVLWMTESKVRRYEENNLWRKSDHLAFAKIINRNSLQCSKKWKEHRQPIKPVWNIKKKKKKNTENQNETKKMYFNEVQLQIYTISLMVHKIFDNRACLVKGLLREKIYSTNKLALVRWDPWETDSEIKISMQKIY